MFKVLVFKAAFRVLGPLPHCFLYPLATLVAEIAYRTLPALRSNVQDNLRHAVPEYTSPKTLRALTKRVFRNVVLYYADILHLPYMDMDEFCRTRLVLRGLDEHLFPALKSGRGVVILSAHSGNAELAVQGLIPHGVRVLALTEPLRPTPLSIFFDGLRSTWGHTFQPVSVANVKRVMQTLKQGGAVALMGDRDIRGPRMRLPFLGSETLMPTGPIEVALRTGAVVLPAFSKRTGKYGLEARVEAPLDLRKTGDFQEDVREGQLLFLQRLERHVKADPGQWLVLERIWDGASEEATPMTAAGSMS